MGQCESCGEDSDIAAMIYDDPNVYECPECGQLCCIDCCGHREDRQCCNCFNEAREL